MNVKNPQHNPDSQLRLITAEPSNGDRLAVIDEDEVAAGGGTERTEEVENEKEDKVTWASLPHRKQLIILTLARLSEPLVQTSLQVSIQRYG